MKLVEVARDCRHRTRSVRVDLVGPVACLQVCERGEPRAEITLNRSGVAQLLTLLSRANAAMVAYENLVALVERDQRDQGEGEV